MVLEKVISGAQTGSDQAGLFAAKDYGIPTGGTVPFNCRTTNGCRPELMEEYGLDETNSSGYTDRTRANVKNSDGTIILVEKDSTSGTKITQKFARLEKKHCLLIHINEPEMTPQEVYDWLVENEIGILNVAGNSARSAPEIYEKVVRFMSQVFSIHQNGF